MLTRFSRIWAVTALVLVLGLLSKPATADTLVVDDLVCLGPSDVLDDVLICDGGVLILDGTCVTGDIKIKRGGALKAFLANIEGCIKADRAFLVELTFSQIGGCIELKQTGGKGTVLGDPPYIYLLANSISGNVRIERSDVFSLNVSYNQICRKLVLKYNEACLPIVCEFNGRNPPPPPPPPPPPG